MRLEQLEYLVDIAKTKSINITAERMFVTQPAISEAVHKLEEELSADLLVRSKKGVELTEAGKVARRWASIVLENIEMMKADVIKTDQHYDAELCGELVIGAVPFISRVLLPTIVSDFSKQYPKIAITAFEMRRSEMETLLERKKIDLGLFNSVTYDLLCAEEVQKLLEHSDQLYHEMLYMEPVQVIANKSFAISREKMVSLAEVVQYPLVLFVNADIHAEKDIVNILKRYGDLDIVINTSDVMLCKKAIINGSGIGFFAKSTFGTVFFEDVHENDLLKVIRVKEKIKMSYYLIYETNKQLTPVEQAFVNYLKATLKTY